MAATLWAIEMGNAFGQHCDAGRIVLRAPYLARAGKGDVEMMLSTHR